MRGRDAWSMPWHTFCLLAVGRAKGFPSWPRNAISGVNKKMGELVWQIEGVDAALEDLGKIDLEMIEVQSGSYLDEDDIVRFEDKYGRA